MLIKIENGDVKIENATVEDILFCGNLLTTIALKKIDRRVEEFEQQRIREWLEIREKK